MNYRAASCMLSAAMCLMNLLPPFGAGAAVQNPQSGAYPLFAVQTNDDASGTAEAGKYKDEFYLHLDVFGHQVYETEAPIVNLSISDPSIALCIMSESKDYLNIQALTSGTCEIIVTLANGDVYAVHLTVGSVSSIVTNPPQDVTTEAPPATAATTTTVSVTTLPPMNIIPDSVTLTNGERITLDVNRSGADIKYKTNNPDVAVVSTAGVITAVGVGQAIITAVYADSETAQIAVQVKPAAPAVTTTVSATTTTTTVTTAAEPVTTTTAAATTAGGTSVNFSISADAWNFSSESSQFFAKKHGAWERFLTDAHLKQLKKICSPMEWGGIDGVAAHMKEHGNGTCYGMSLLSMMQLLDMVSPSDILNGAESLYAIPEENTDAISIINYHHLLQYRSACQDAMHQSRLNQNLLDSLLDVLNDGKPAFVVLNTDHVNPAKMHAVVAVGYVAEPVTLVLWGTAKQFDGYIRLYDPAVPNEEEKMYFNRKTHEWYISNYRECASWLPNIRLRAVFSDLDILAAGSPFSGSAVQTKKHKAQMIFAANGNYNKPEWIDPNPSGGIGGAPSQNNVVTECEMFDISGTAVQNMKKYEMLYNTDDYLFSFCDNKADSARVEMKYENQLFYVESEKLNNVRFSPNGMTFSSEASDYSLHTIRDLNPEASGIDLLRITGKSAGKTEFRQISSNSWSLSSETPLGTLEISAESGTETASRNVLTGAKKITVCADSPDNISIRYDWGDHEAEPSAAESGDINFDGEVSVEDAQLALKHYTTSVAGNPAYLPEDNQSKMDVNGDGALSVDDAQLILMYYTQKIVSQMDITWTDLLKAKK